MALDLKKALRKELRQTVYKSDGPRKRWMYLFLCIDCEKEIWYEECNLSKQQGRCLKCAAKINAITARKSAIKRPYEAVYNRLAKTALNRSLLFALTYEDFLEYILTTECHYCGSLIRWSKYTGSGKSQAANLDRKDNTLGYTRENSVVACVICNRIKNKYLTYQDMMLLSPMLRRIIPGKHQHAKSATANS
jgi:5-methylcytosine-specific restriction endonuclease McrA